MKTITQILSLDGRNITNTTSVAISIPPIINNVFKNTMIVNNHTTFIIVKYRGSTIIVDRK